MVLGRSTEATAPDALRAVFAEFIATFLFVFIGVGSCIAHSKLSDGPLEAAGLVCIAIAHGLAIAVTVAATANISGGHVNPAVTFGLAVGGYITLVRAAFYWIAQLLGATLAAYLLKAIIITTGLSMPIHGLGAGVSVTGGLILETVLTFALVFVVYATAVDVLDYEHCHVLNRRSFGDQLYTVMPLGSRYIDITMSRYRRSSEIVHKSLMKRLARSVRKAHLEVFRRNSAHDITLRGTG
ncbi:hypothetical protein AXG93_1275s1010 [Marchantia polymorpha subsp. ruderalis]|uniref:Uncharacterized protein n=1 Tax=Marchantia polymorpha subsp. ruderalis TaxID=1480154 RepID=A0A176VMY7_MARPO|nr:hypothetical protein AXG93_1275s1010 [Marchantia polymorpha subsp. ruderalis]